MDPTVENYRARQGELLSASDAIIALSDAEKRELSVEEKGSLTQNSAEVERLEGEIGLRETINAQRAATTKLNPRKVSPDPVPGGVSDDEPAPRAAASPRAHPQPRVSAGGNSGFRSFGEYARAVRAGSLRGGEIDPRLRNAAATIISTEGIGADGGFAVPPDFRSEIEQLIFAQDSLVGRTDQLTSSSNTLTIPVDMTTPWQATGGVQAYWDGEGGTKAQSKIALENVTVRLHKLAALIPVTEELIEDAPALDAYLRRKVPEKMDFKLSDAIVRGTGAGMPLGFMNAPALVTVAAEGGQTADTINATNVLKMLARLPVENRLSAVWLIHPDAEVQLPLMTIGDQPVYMPPGGLSDAPFGRLLGRTVIPHQVAATVGDLGDIMLVDLRAYLTIRKGGGIRTDVSMHLWFDQDLVAFRFVLRVAGQPWWSAPIAQRSGSNTMSPYVTLAAR